MPFQSTGAVVRWKIYCLPLGERRRRSIHPPGLRRRRSGKEDRLLRILSTLVPDGTQILFQTVDYTGLPANRFYVVGMDHHPARFCLNWLVERLGCRVAGTPTEKEHPF